VAKYKEIGMLLAKDYGQMFLADKKEAV